MKTLTEHVTEFEKYLDDGIRKYLSDGCIPINLQISLERKARTLEGLNTFGRALIDGHEKRNEDATK